MGRGRQKAKHTKIARELKSFSPSVNYAALERELGHPDDEQYVDKWADDLDDELDDDDADGEEDEDDSETESSRSQSPSFT